MAAISEEAIRERAYLIWEREGRPHGCDYEHWVRAQVELLAELPPGNGGKAVAPRARGAGAKAAARATNSKSAAARAGAKSAAKPSRPGARAGRKPKKSS